ncbi:MAG: recombinase family protein [Bacillota bacterium]|nr:recombinase family protein [Bacillota bacterium]
MRVALYIRVSTKLQEERFSLSAQEKELLEYAISKNWTVVEILKDVDSGGKLEKKGLNELMDLAEEGSIDVVLCIDQDRLSRLNTVEWEFLKDVLRDNNVKIAEPGSMVDLKNEDQEFISDIKNLIAKLEKRKIVRRMMRGKRQKLREGQGWGKAPLGYKFNKTTKKYELDENWSWVIPFIDDLYLTKNLGMIVIAHELNKISKTPSGRFWNETLVQRRLLSKAFHGVMEKTFSNGETISIDGIYPPLRTEETWKQIQMEREKRKTRFKVDARQNENIHFLRQTFITCGHCSRKLHVANHGTKTHSNYYIKHGRKLKLKDRSVCDISINTIRFDDKLTLAIKDILKSEEIAKRYINLESNDQEINLLKRSIKAGEKSLKQLQEKRDKLLDLFLDGEFPKNTLNEKNAILEKERLNQEKIYLQQKAKLDALEKNSWNYDLIYEYLEIAENLDELTHLEKVQLIGNLFPTATCYKDRLVLVAELEQGFPVEFEIPIEPDPFAWHHTKNK